MITTSIKFTKLAFPLLFSSIKIERIAYLDLHLFTLYLFNTQFLILELRVVNLFTLGQLSPYHHHCSCRIQHKMVICNSHGSFFKSKIVNHFLIFFSIFSFPLSLSLLRHSFPFCNSSLSSFHILPFSSIFSLLSPLLPTTLPITKLDPLLFTQPMAFLLI